MNKIISSMLGGLLNAFLAFIPAIFFDAMTGSHEHSILVWIGMLAVLYLIDIKWELTKK